MLSGGLSETRRRIAQLLALICPEMSLETVSQLIVQLSEVIDHPSAVASLLSPAAASAGAAQSSAAQVAASIHHSETVHGAVLGLGVLVARCVKMQVVPRLILSRKYLLIIDQSSDLSSHHCRVWLVPFWSVRRVNSSPI